MRLDLITFLRRWAIIVLEDAMVHIHYPVLVWLMAAVSKGFHLPLECIAWLLGHVKATVSYPFQCIVSTIKHNDPIILNSERIYNLPLETRDLIYALQLRKGFGGMSGDAVMIDDLCQGLVKCIKQSRGLPESLKKHFSFPIALILPEEVKSLGLGDWELAAIDFHVSDIIKKWKALLDPVDSQKWSMDDLKSCMWEASAGINRRTRVSIHPNGSVESLSHVTPDPFIVSFWKRYQPRLSQLARSILKSHEFKSQQSRD